MDIMWLRLNNFLLVLRCFARALYRGAARRKCVPPRRAVVIQRAALGDMVCTTPFFTAFKLAFPKCSLTVVGNALNKELLAHNADVDEYVVWKGVDETIALLRRGNFDIGFLVAPSPDSLASLLLAGIPQVVASRMSGKTPFQTLSYRLLLMLCDEAKHTLGHYAPREYLRLLEPFGVSASDTAKRLVFSRVAEENIMQFFANQEAEHKHLRVGIAPAAGAKFKEWLPARFGELAGRIAKELNAHIFIIGSVADRQTADEMKKAMPSTVHLTDTVGQWNIDELKAFISKLDLFVSADTGPIYIAEAFGVSTVDIVGPVDERDQPPHRPHHAVVFDETRAKPVTGVFTNKFFDMVEARRQTEAISVEQAFRAVRTVL